MRIRIAAIMFLTISFILPTALFAANPKAGTTCAKQGITQNYAGKKFTCIKSGKKLTWDKGVSIASVLNQNSNSSGKTIEQITNTVDWTKTYSTDEGYKHLYTNPCQREENIEKQWEDLQNAYFKFSNCIWPISVAKYTLGNQKPKTTEILNTSAMDQCAISEPENSDKHRAFLNNWPAGKSDWFNSKRVPGPNMHIQVIPLYAEDTAKPINSPEYDYKRFTDFLADWISQSSDHGSNVTIQFPKEYIKFNNTISSYGIFHEARHDSPEHARFNKDIVSQVDSIIDFTGVNLAIIVAPAGTDASVLSQASIGELITREGIVRSTSSEFPYVLDNFGSIKFKNLMLPYWWLHELYHVGFGIEHHDGDGLEDINSEYGLGAWTLMSHGGGDLLGWDKWLVGFIDNSQVNCVASNLSSVTWIVPSSVKSLRKKLTVVPISRYKVLVIESIRASGLYYKLPATSEGVLVYEIDLTNNFLSTGMKLVLPTNRDPNKGPFFLAEATLRQGESVLSNGHRITVLESGNFGDVVKVEVA